MDATDALGRSGVYRIFCSGNGKLYIGSSINIPARWSTHRSYLRLNRHHNKHLQNAWNKHGPLSFTFEVIEVCNPCKVIEREQAWIDSTGCASPAIGMNNSPTATTRVGFRHSEETKARISELASKRENAHLRAANEARKGKPGKKGITGWVWTEEHKRRASESRKGREPWNRGIPQTPETKAKIALSASKSMRVISDETRAKIKVLRAQGLSYPKISVETGVSISQCHKIVTDQFGKYKRIS